MEQRKSIGLMKLFGLVLTGLMLAREAESVAMDMVTCGSIIKLVNVRHNVRVHSHDVKYGSGSGQQSVTGMPDMDDHNSHWTIMAPKAEKACRRGEPVRCESVIRLKHLATGCFLHSHLFNSPLSNNQEVSCFGSDTKSDTGDNWSVDCVEGDEEWHRSEQVILKHVDTGKYLAVTGHTYNQPIDGQNEVVTVSSKTSETNFKTGEGVYIKPSEDEN